MMASTLMPEVSDPAAGPSDCDTPIFLTPFPAARFLADILDRQRLIIRRDKPGHFNDVITLDELDTLVTSVRIPASNVNLAQGDTPLPRTAYCLGNDYVDKDRVLAHHRDGATIILRAVEQWSASLNRLRRDAERFFGCECQVNVYITPPGQKSTPPHWDTHDLVVMQIAGSKVWRVYEGRRSLPLSDERFGIGTDYVSANHEDIELVAGDTLYLPRGIIHEPVAQDYSVHLSIGVHVVRWHQVLELALRLLAEREGSALRHRAAGAADSMPEQLLDELGRLAEPTLVQAARLLLDQQFERARTCDRKGMLLELASPRNETTPPALGHSA